MVVLGLWVGGWVVASASVAGLGGLGPALGARRLRRRPSNGDAGRWAGVVAEIAEQYRDRHRLLVGLGRGPGGLFAHAALERHIEIRDRSCTFMGCRCPARHCDLDHTVDHAYGGATTVCNLGPGRGRHHPYKHMLGWRLHQPRPGHFIWTSPLARTYHTRGQPIVPPPPPHVPRTRTSDDDPRPPPDRDDESANGRPPF